MRTLELIPDYYARFYDLPPMSDRASGLLIKIAKNKYIQPGTNKLCYMSNGRKVMLKSIEHITGLSESTVKRSIKDLVDVGVMAKHEGSYYFNPSYIRVGEDRMDKETLDLFDSKDIIKGNTNFLPY